MGWNNNIFPLLIVVSGPPFTGLFVYSPAPGAGNLVASITASAGTDPYGNHYDAGITSYDNTFGGVSNLLGAALQIFAGVNLLEILNPSGFFIYSPSAGAGKLIASIAPAAGTDGFTNAFPKGIASIAAGVAEITMLNGTLLLQTLGANASASAAIVTVGSTAAGQHLELGSGQGPEAGAIQSLLILNDSGLGLPGLQVVDGRDGNSYGTERLIQANAANVTLSNTAFTNVFTGVSVAATAYLVKADLLISVGATATALIFQLTGPVVGAAANIKWRVSYESGTGESVFAGHSIGSLASVTLPGGATFPANAVVHVWLSAYLPFTAASGTNLNLQAETSVASATTQVSLGSTLEVAPV